MPAEGWARPTTWRPGAGIRQPRSRYPRGYLQPRLHTLQAAHGPRQTIQLGRDYRTAFDKMTAHVHAPPQRRPRPSFPAVPKGLVTVIVDRMLAKSPANRFATPAEVADDCASLPYCATVRISSALAKSAPPPSPPLPPRDGRRESALPVSPLLRTEAPLRSTARFSTLSFREESKPGETVRRWKRLLISSFNAARGRRTRLRLGDHPSHPQGRQGMRPIVLPGGSDAAIEPDNGEDRHQVPG